MRGTVNVGSPTTVDALYETNAKLEQKFWRGTKTEHNALVAAGSIDENTQYIVVSSDGATLEIYQGSVPLGGNKSPYQIAVENGYEGTEADYNKQLGALVETSETASALSGKEGQYVGFNSEGKPVASDFPSGSEGQMVGFDSDGKMVAQDVPVSKPSMTVVTLAAASWDSSALTQSVTVTGILADETKQLIQCTPAGASMSVAAEAGIYCSAQGANTLTFTCSEVPSENVQFCVSWQDANYVS